MKKKRQRRCLESQQQALGLALKDQSAADTSISSCLVPLPADKRLLERNGFIVSTHSNPLDFSLDDFAIMCCDYSYDFPLTSVVDMASKLDPGPLMDCMKALGLATFAGTSNAPQLQVSAHKNYLSALSGIKEALQDPIRSRSDETLLTVMIMTHVEIIVQVDRANFDGWSSHVEGELALVQLRGESQLETVEGRMLFMQVATSLLARSIRTDCPLPPILRSFADAAAPHVIPGSQEDLMWTLYRTRMALIGIYHDARRDLLKDHKQAILELLALDTTIDDAMTKRLELAETEHVIFAGQPMSTCDAAMRRFSVSQCRTSVLCVRILLHLTILWILSQPAPDSIDPFHAIYQRELSTSSLTHFQDSILSALPDQIHFISQGNRTNLNLPSSHGIPNGKNRFLSSQISLSTIAYITSEIILICTLKGQVKPDLAIRSSRLLRLSRGVHLLSPLLVVAHVATAGSQRHRRACSLIKSLEDGLQIYGGACLRV